MPSTFCNELAYEFLPTTNESILEIDKVLSELD
jgi:hypothetical protein